MIIYKNRLHTEPMYLVYAIHLRRLVEENIFPLRYVAEHLTPVADYTAIWHRGKRGIVIVTELRGVK